MGGAEGGGQKLKLRNYALRNHTLGRLFSRRCVFPLQAEAVTPPGLLSGSITAPAPRSTLPGFHSPPFSKQRFHAGHSTAVSGQLLLKHTLMIHPARLWEQNTTFSSLFQGGEGLALLRMAMALSYDSPHSGQPLRSAPSFSEPPSGVDHGAGGTAAPETYSRPWLGRGQTDCPGILLLPGRSPGVPAPHSDPGDGGPCTSPSLVFPVIGPGRGPRAHVCGPATTVASSGAPGRSELPGRS